MSGRKLAQRDTEKPREKSLSLKNQRPVISDGDKIDLTGSIQQITFAMKHLAIL